MAQKEARFRARLMQKLKRIPYSHFARIEQQSLRGTADIIGHVSGFFVSIECKASESAKTTRLQIKNMNDIVTSGGIAILCYPENEEKVLSDLRCLQTAAVYVRLQEKYSEQAQELYAEIRDLSQSKVPFGHDQEL
jgi:hypothetical protein